MDQGELVPASRLGFDEAAVPKFFEFFRAPFPDYKVSVLGRLGQFASAAGAIGTVVVFGVAFLLARGLRSRHHGGHSAHAS